MKVVIPGGTGQVGTILDRALTAQGHDVVLLTRSPRGDRQVYWDGSTLGDWADRISGKEPTATYKGIRYLQAELVDPSLAAEPFDRETLGVFQKMFNLTAEERDEVVKVLARDES